LQSNKIIVSQSTQTYFNLAYEEYLLKNSSKDEVTMFLWQSKNAVVIGSNQNPWKECNIAKLNEDNVVLARRLSGGGAVYHDKGNLNFTFVMGNELYNEKRQLKVIIDALAEYNIKAEFSGRNDILVNGKKVSGNAYFFDDNNSFHHGTLLIDEDVTKLLDYLTVSTKKLKSKGIDSVVSRVINLKDINKNISVDSVKASLKKSFKRIYGDFSLSTINESFKEDSVFLPIYSKYSSYEWIYGNTPGFEVKFDEHFDWGEIQIDANISNLFIKDVKIYSDCLNVAFIDNLTKSLMGVKYSHNDIKSAVFNAVHSEKENQMAEDIITKWFE
jgi:lipoate-protein ligase A